MGSSRKPKSVRAKSARPGEPPRTREMLLNASNQTQTEVLEIPPRVLDEIENQRSVLVTVITLLHCLHVVLEHRQDQIDEEPQPRIEAAVRWVSLPEMTILLLERTHDVLSALDSNNLRNALPEQQTISIQRDADNLVLSVTDALGRITQLSHDGFGNVSTVTRLFGTADAVSDAFKYDPTYQQLTTYTDPLGHITSFGYDWLGNLTSIADPLGDAVQLTNDSFGRPNTITNALGKVTQVNYELGDLSSVVDPLGRPTSIFHDAVGRPTGASDAAGHNTSIQYDGMDRVQQVTDALGGQTTLHYDENGNVLTFQDARSAASHGFSYDGRNRLHVYTDPLGISATYNYDGMGNLTSKIDRKNQTTLYSYDGLNRLHTITYADSSSITITWDAGNRPTQFVDTVNGTITRHYDGLDRLTEEDSPQGQINYGYDAAGRRNQMTVSGLTPVTYQYDDANRLTQIAQGTAIVGIAYDAANRRSTVTLPNGIVATPTFDDANQLRALSYDRSGVHVGDLAYTYDQAGRRTGQSGSLATLAMPGSISSATYDSGNRLTNWGGSTLNYDANGNLTGIGSSSLTWNSRDQLVATSDGSSEFSYDPLGRRSSRQVSGSNTSYLYDGMNPATVGGSQILAGQGLDEFYAQTNSGTTTTYLSDALGSTVALADSSGSIAGSYAYGPYGVTSHSGTATASLQYTGRENDGDTNLYYYRARYYSASLNRFVSQDPIGLGGGVNVYAYANGNPVSYRDPSGKDPLVVIGAIIGGVAGAVQAANAGGGWNEGNALNILTGAATGAAVGALAGLVPTSAGPLATLITGALAGGGGNIASQVTSYGVARLTTPSECPAPILSINYRQAGVQALLGASTATLGFATGFTSGYSILQGGGSLAQALENGALVNALTSGAAQIVGNDLIPLDYGGLIF